MIPLCRPVFALREREYVEECFSTGWVVTGRFVEAFEQALSKRLNGAHVVTVNSGTTALMLALRAVGVREGTCVLMPVLTFKATENAVRACGARPMLLDVDDGWTLDPQAMRHTLWHGLHGRPVSAVVPVHLNGVPATMQCAPDVVNVPFVGPTPRTFAWLQKIVEDAAGALGSTVDGQPVGTIGRVGIFSFNANKIITAAGGGAVVTQDKRIADEVRDMSRHVRDGDGTRGEANLLLTNLQAAVGLAQLETLDERLAAKARIAARYTEELKPYLTPQPVPQDATSNHWLYTVRCMGGSHRQRIEAAMAAAGIEVRRLWKPLGYGVNAEATYATALSLPCSVDLSEADQEAVIQCARSA